MPAQPGSLRDHVVCVRCAAALDLNELHCTRCQQPYGKLGAIPILLPRIDDHLSLWRSQLAALQAQGGPCGVDARALAGARPSAARSSE
jgi:hypothetical protein